VVRTAKNFTVDTVWSRVIGVLRGVYTGWERINRSMERSMSIPKLMFSVFFTLNRFSVTSYS